MDKIDTVYVTSNSDCTIGVLVPELHLKRTWTKRGQKLVFDREDLIQAFYDPATEYLFRHGMLITDDKAFKVAVGLISDESEDDGIVEITEALLKRLIKAMPLPEVKEILGKMSVEQRDDLGNYAIEHYKDLSMDRIDLLSKATNRNLMKSIENYKAAQED